MVEEQKQSEVLALAKVKLIFKPVLVLISHWVAIALFLHSQLFLLFQTPALKSNFFLFFVLPWKTPKQDQSFTQNCLSLNRYKPFLKTPLKRLILHRLGVFVTRQPKLKRL